MEERREIVEGEEGDSGRRGGRDWKERREISSGRRGGR